MQFSLKHQFQDNALNHDFIHKLTSGGSDDNTVAMVTEKVSGDTKTLS